MRRTIFVSTGVITSVLLTANMALSSIDASVVNLRLSTFNGTATAAAVFNGFAVCAVVSITFSRVFRLRPAWFHRWVLPCSGALIGIAAAILTINMLVLKKINPSDVSDSASKSQFQISNLTGFTIWALANAAQIGFYAVVAFLRLSGHASEPPSEPLTLMGEKRHVGVNRPPSPPARLRIVAPPFIFPADSKQLSPSPTESRRHSWRDSLASLHQVVRPATSASRTRLLANRTARSSMSRDSTSLQSDTRSISNSIRSDLFDSWDLSNPETQTRDTLGSTFQFGIMPSKGTTLEPIPGSRPVSPARTLDGPFHERPHTALSNTSRHDRPGTAFSQNSRINLSVSRPGSRAASPSLHEAHIHPLFRTDSPTPAPGASPGTVVVASSFSGQVIGQVMNSPRPSLNHSRMRSTEGYFSRTPSRVGGRSTPIDSVRGSLDEREESVVVGGTSTPGTRSIAPAIPEFVLSASKERSI
jgi:hypothetical protein